MKVSDDLTALVFELQRARSPVEKGRTLARAWRTIRGLSATERRLLVREVGFDGAEDLVEGLAGKGGASFAPAAVLEALGMARKNEGLSLRGILADLRDPDRRDDLLGRGLDLVADVLDGDDEEEDVPLWSDGAVELEVPHRHPDGEPIPEALEVQRSVGNRDRAILSGEPVEPELPPSPQEIEEPEEEAAPPPEALKVPEPEPPKIEKDPALWEDVWETPAPAAPAVVAVVSGSRRLEPVMESGVRKAASTVLHRLRDFRDGIEDLRPSGRFELTQALETLPEPWAKRRAIVALVEAGIPADPSITLDLIEGLDRPMDRRWCISALARRGGLSGDDLDRALAMLASPAARRRLEGLVERASPGRGALNTAGG